MSDPTWYPVRLGPLRLRAAVGPESETLGDKLEAVGAALVPGERGPRSVPLVLAIRGSEREVDDRAAGLRLRRQVRGLLENTAWLAGGLYLEAAYDPESRCWLAVGSGELAAGGRGVTFGDWRLTLEAWSVGRPSTVRRGRTVVCVDRAASGIASDTRRQLYTADRASWPSSPTVALPAGAGNILGLDGRPWSSVDGPTVDGRSLWRAGEALAGESLAWVPNPLLVPGPTEMEAAAEDHGAVRAWSIPLGDTSAMTPTGDRAPELYGWERVLGHLEQTIAWTAVDNGWCRVVWRGDGLHLERWSTSGAGQYVRVATIAHATGMSESRVVELTPERAVISWLIGDREMRAILQRGWPGPRIESYGSPTTTTARLAVTGPGPVGRVSVAAGVDRITTAAGAVLCASSHNAVTWSGTTEVASGWAGEWSAPRVFCTQLDVHDGAVDDLRRRARWDVQPQPILMTR